MQKGSIKGEISLTVAHLRRRDELRYEEMKSRVQELSIEIENGNEKINSNLADLVRKQKEFHLWVTADSTDSEKSLDRIEDIISTDLETDEMMKLFNRTSEVLELILKSHSGQSFKTSAGKTLFIFLNPWKCLETLQYLGLKFKT